MSLETEATLSADHVRVLVENHARFLAFLKGRVGSRETAEEILQAAFVKSIEKQDSLRDGEHAVAWFYRLLRNSLIDHYRRQAALERGAQRYVAENPEGEAELQTAL